MKNAIMITLATLFLGSIVLMPRSCDDDHQLADNGDPAMAIWHGDESRGQTTKGDRVGLVEEKYPYLSTPDNLKSNFSKMIRELEEEGFPLSRTQIEKLKQTSDEELVKVVEVYYLTMPHNPEGWKEALTLYLKDGHFPSWVAFHLDL